MMLKMQNKMESSNKFAEQFRELNESFEQLKCDLAIAKMVIASSTIALLTCRGNAGQMPRILGENVWKSWVYPLQSRIINLKKSSAKLSIGLDLKLIIEILNAAIVFAVKAVR